MSDITLDRVAGDKHITSAMRDEALAALARHDALDLVEALGLDTEPQERRDPGRRAAPFRHARRVRTTP